MEAHFFVLIGLVLYTYFDFNIEYLNCKWAPMIFFFKFPGLRSFTKGGNILLEPMEAALMQWLTNTQGN